MKNWKILPIVFNKKLFVAALLATLFFIIVPIRTVMSDCGISLKNYSFVHTDIMESQSDYAPYLMGYGILSNYLMLEKREPEIEDNIGEWRGRFCDIPDSADIDKILYDTDIDELADLRETTNRYSKKDVFYQLQDNTFAQVIKENGCTEVVDYLIFAKNCEKYCVKGEEWSEKPKDVAQMFFWINTGRQQFKNTKSYFLKLRYAYQIIRLAHYAKDYKAVIDIYNDVMPKTDKINSIINYWILGHKAGALKALGKRAEAAYLFAVVFRYCPSKRRQAFESFDIKTDLEWRQCLNLCRDDRERGALYAIRASYDKAKAFEDMKELYRLDPKNEHLEMLLIRETLRLEKVLLGSSFRKQNYSTDIIKKNTAYCVEFQNFVRKVANENLVKNPALWRTTEGYLSFLLGDWFEAKNTFAQARKIAKNNILIEQIDAFDLATRIVGLQVSDVANDSIMNLIRNHNAYLSDTDFEELFHDKVASIYRKTGHPGIAYLTDYSIRDLEKNPHLTELDDLIALCRKPLKTQYELELVTLNGKKTIETMLWNVKARYHLSRFEMEAANECFKRIPDNERGKKYTPFLDKINDCVGCNSTDSVLYNRAEFTQQMLYLEYQIRISSPGIAVDTNYYKLGLGYYNMTYFGNSSGIADYYRSGKSWGNINSGKNVFSLTGFPMGNYEVTDVSLALEYFEKARQLTQNRELQARCAFWSAKCEQILFFLSKDNHYTFNNQIAPTVPPQYHRYFKLLKEYYSDTQFYKQAATECKYFQFYTTK